MKARRAAKPVAAIHRVTGSQFGDPIVRGGLHIRGSDAHPEVRHAVIRFARWLRAKFPFPIRVPVYLFPTEQIMTGKRELVSASFFAPFDRSVEPYIRVSTGDYTLLRQKNGRDNALASILCSVAHEVVHYQQWSQGRELCEREALRRASAIVRSYWKTVLHP